MITALDSNIISELLDRTPKAAAVAARLAEYQTEGPLVICGVVYAELHARPAITRTTLDHFLDATSIHLDTTFSAAAWAEAGRANADYHARRRAGGLSGVRPVLPDLLIGAHAQHHANRLFTLNVADFGDFPGLRVVTL